MATSATIQKFHYVEESDDVFLNLFPHRYDYICADYPDAGEKPQWKTESRYPLSDRLIHQSDALFGVRFGKQTRYCLLDIDITSPYHPRRDPFAISNLAAVLEPLGLVSYVACTSSYSNGIHLYFPFQKSQSSWEVAAAVAALLEKSGFKLVPGRLELFPNPKPYVAGGHPTLFHAHRLPMQMGSYLLNEDLQSVWSDRATFVQRWQFAQERNMLQPKLLKQLVRFQQKSRQISGKAEKFMADLNAEVEVGWTGSGQTNHLLGRIALRTYVFHHVLFGGVPLTGQALVDQIVATARSLPGYQEWCQHQHEIETRAAEWARCVEGSRYFPYSSRRSGTEVTEQSLSALSASKPSPSWNQRQSEGARERIKQAITHLLEANTLPVTPTARFQALTQFGIGGSSLYRHRDLWHPAHLMDNLAHLVDQPVENPPDPPTSNPIEVSDSARGASDTPNSTSLFLPTGSNVLRHLASGRSLDPPSASGCNSSHAFHARSLDQRMQQFLESGDPILVAEAVGYFDHQRINRQQSGQSGQLQELQELQAQQQEELQTIEVSICRWQDRVPDYGLDYGREFVLDRGSSQFFTEDRPDDWLRSVEISSEGLPSEDISDLLATISVQIRLLGWAKEQVNRHLRQQFGKSHQSRLSNGELVKWLEWLKAYKFPADTG